MTDNHNYPDWQIDAAPGARDAYDAWQTAARSQQREAAVAALRAANESVSVVGKHGKEHLIPRDGYSQAQLDAAVEERRLARLAADAQHKIVRDLYSAFEAKVREFTGEPLKLVAARVALASYEHTRALIEELERTMNELERAGRQATPVSGIEFVSSGPRQDLYPVRASLSNFEKLRLAAVRDLVPSSGGRS